MVTLPPQFVATKYSGYFWNIEDERLYSLKITGELRPLKHTKPNRWNNLWQWNETGGYKISDKGTRRWLTDSHLAKLTPTDSTIPVMSDIVNYVVTTQGWSGKKVTECETVEQAWHALGDCSVGAITSVQSPTGKDVRELIEF